MVIIDERSGDQLIFPPRPWQDDIKILKLSCTHCSLGSLGREILQTELRLNENNIFSVAGTAVSHQILAVILSIWIFLLV